jgi:hypothetical protein
MWDSYMHASRFIVTLAACFLASVLSPAVGVAAPTLTLSTFVSEPALQVGQETTVSVRATITGGAANDGLTAFDLDLFPLDKSGIHFVGLATLDPTAVLLSAGTFEPASGGIRGISGVYNPVGVAIGAPVTLFTVMSDFPNGVGIPFQLNVSGDYLPSNSNFTVVTSGAVAPVHVGAVPEPASLMLSALGAALLLRRGRSQRRR